MKKKAQITASVAVLADDPAVARGRRDVEPLGQEEPEPRRVEIGAAADDPVLGQARELPGDVGQYVDGIGDDEENGVGTVLDQLGYDALEDVGVALHEVQPGLALALPRPRRHDADARAGRGRVVRARVYLGVLEEGAAVLEVHHLALELVGHHVDQHHVARDALRARRFGYFIAYRSIHQGLNGNLFNEIRAFKGFILSAVYCVLNKN